jgi:hypothetical protein
MATTFKLATEGSAPCTIDVALCKYSAYLSNVIEFEGSDEVHMVPTIIGIRPETLEHFVLFLETWHNLPDESKPNIESNLRNMQNTELPPELYRYIVRNETQNPKFLVNLIKAADFFNVDPLVNLAVKYLVLLIKEFPDRTTLAEWLKVD